ncbi:MurR/RpiR family transcriptional regulator [Bacillus tropicus]|uniref:MurR/RpiR family transcriptional regulator n=1 Tax=Bacillus tropicus TaxID=2026188 RepID=UPI0023B1F696|nr:MurR/RpiR family transcriptional regulator [Bacillus tropicus]MDE7553159.1 MurR/RpiR family transcriptional regulator [Bacillus tropicus]MDE7574095.1 MurR/RpiR family transcriptional regulator [Bacillus tropicus]MDF9558105.1 MurR/RpiR family transcriptional regulator [Bacillus tropicus]MDF9590063.1 MurR/RpiR family transcriptional regulator [Bacillus tropicus]MDF9648911.1 MurR/RpiR family transcriptional regulator [Bacillus tropicus]
MDLKEIIQEEYNQLSKGQQRVAKYLLEKPGDFAVKSAGEIGEQVGVSETTVIRFCYSIKLSGFSELQKVVREQLIFMKSSLGQYFSSKLELAEQPHFYAKVMGRDCQYIQDTINNIDENEFERVVDQLVKTDKIYVLGLKSSFSAANWLTMTLGLVRGNVQILHPETNDLLCTLSEMDHKSTLIAISFHRYLKETIKVAEMAKEQGAFVIGITDSPLAPIREYADAIFPMYSSEKSTIDATPVLFSFLNAIVAGVSIKDKDRFEKRKERYEKLSGDYFFV